MKRKKKTQAEKNEAIYARMKKQGLSDREIAESVIFPSELTPEEKAESDKYLNEYRKLLRENRTPEENRLIVDSLKKLQAELNKKDEE